MASPILTGTQAFLNSSSVKAALNQTSSALAALNVLKSVCVHPALLTDRAAHQAARGASKHPASQAVPEPGTRWGWACLLCTWEPLHSAP